jgi:hypothetical protein
VGFFVLTKNEHGSAKLDERIIGFLDYWAAEQCRSSRNPFIHQSNNPTIHLSRPRDSWFNSVNA